MMTGMAGSCSFGFSFSTVGNILAFNVTTPKMPSVD